MCTYKRIQYYTIIYNIYIYTIIPLRFFVGNVMSWSTELRDTVKNLDTPVLPFILAENGDILWYIGYCNRWGFPEHIRTVMALSKHGTSKIQWFLSTCSLRMPMVGHGPFWRIKLYSHSCTEELGVLVERIRVSWSMHDNDICYPLVTSFMD